MPPPIGDHARALDLPANTGRHAVAYTAPGGSPSAEKIMLLASLVPPVAEKAGSSA